MSTGATALTAPPAAPPDGGAPQDWRTSLPEEIRGEESIKNFKDVADLTKGFIETKKMVGNATKIPKNDAKPEEWDAFYSKLGRPESPDKYEFKLPEGGAVDEKLLGDFKTAAHATGLQPRQAQNLLEWFNKTQGESVSNYTKTMEEDLGKLKSEWGDNFEANAKLATGLVKQHGGDKAVALMQNPYFGDNPDLVRTLGCAAQEIAALKAQIQKLTGEDSLILGDAPSGQDTKDAIIMKIAEIQNDPKHAYNDPRAPRDVREAAIREMSKLHQQLG